MPIFKQVSPRVKFPELEDKITEFWKANKIFEKSVEQRPVSDKYVFYDGPPFITGMPHYGHLLGSIAKDVVPRYWTMNGKRVERVWGWDCHGLPIENKVEEKIGLKNRRDIENFGIKEFVDECYKYTEETSAEWEWYVDKIGRWVDFENSYKTMDQDYMETVIWVFKQLWDKKLVYQGTRVSLFCTRCGTPVSNFEIAMDNSYEDMEDPAVTVKFPLEGVEGTKFEGASILAWTTTPWTLPSNRALVVDENEDYIVASVQKLDIELEKAWLVKNLPEDLTKQKSSQITQAYLEDYTDENGNKPKDARIRKDGDKYTFTVKYFAGNEAETGQLTEKTEEITKERYVELIKQAAKKVVKTRYYYPLENNLVAEVDIYQNNLQGLVVAEVEFPSLQAEKNFTTLEWFDKEVTDSKGIYPPVIADMDYKEIEKMNKEYEQQPHNFEEHVQNEKVIVAKKRTEAVFGEADFETLSEFKGSELVGLSYSAPFDYYPPNDKDWKVYSYEGMVTMEEGTGIVHSAPGFGEIDTEMGNKVGLTIMFAVNDEGKFQPEVTDYAGMYIKEADQKIISDLINRGLMFKSERITHRYPYCYRCHTPLIQKAQPSWFVDIQSMKKDMLKNNENINWVPDHLKEGRFAKGIEQAPDWGISRSRYWATPMPVWKCTGMQSDENIKVIMVHGNGAPEEGFEKSDRGWFPYLLGQLSVLGIKAHAPNMPEPEIAPMNKWLPYLENEMGVDENTIIIGHSSGAVAAMRYAETHKIKGLILVAGCHTDLGDEIEKKSGYFDQPWNWDAIKENTDWIIQYHSDDDPYIPVEEADHIHQNLDSEFNLMKGEGHFSHSLDDKTEFPEIVEDIKQKLDYKACDNIEVFGSRAEIEEKSGQKIDNFHRPYIDQITIPCEKCGGIMKRIPEVLDVWMDSGSMPYAERHYPFENKEDFEASYPADYIVEYIAQTRAWFYTMHVISTGIFNSESFKNVVATGVMAGTDGRKMSKSYGNYPDPKGVLEQYGAEAMRMYFMGSPLMVGDDMNISEDGFKEQIKTFLLPFWNSYSFFVTYANIHNWRPRADLVKIQDKVPFDQFSNKLDEWVVAKLQLTIRNVRVSMEQYNLPAAVRELPEFINDLSKWYIRRSRDRFNAGDQQAMDTLYYILVEFAKLSAPFIPFLSEEIWQNLVVNELKDQPESIHLVDYPKYDINFVEKMNLMMEQMSAVREIVNLGQAIRVEKGIKVRQPLAEMEVNLDIQIQRDLELEEWMKELIADELNVKVIDEDNQPSQAEGWEYRKSPSGQVQVSLNTSITDALKREGIYRELVRFIQAKRKQEKFDVFDKIKVKITTKSNEILVAIDEYKEELISATNAGDLDIKKDKPKTGFKLNGLEVDLEISK